MLPSCHGQRAHLAAQGLVGARNIFDKDPPLASGGYLSNLYQPQARYWYTSIKKSF